MSIDATAGGTSANSYLTVAEADSYFSERPHSASWTDLPEADQESALIFSTRVIEARISALWDKRQLPKDATVRVLTDIKQDFNSYMVWTGKPANSDQALAWPRSGMKNQNGFNLPDNEIPKRLKDFQCEVALKLIQEDRTLENPANAQGLAGLQAGPVNLSWKSDTPNPKVIPDSAIQFLVKSWWFAFELKYRAIATLGVI